MWKPSVRTLFLILFLFSLFHSPSHARDASPILVIDSGGHNSNIRKITFTRDGKYLLSASDDKTLRVWDVRTGKISRTIRGLIGEGPVGKIFAAALSPDNEWLAVGGWMATFTGNNYKDIGAIRLYRFSTGKLVGLLKGHTNVVSSLVFSPDSKYLASGSHDFTVGIWEIKSGKMLHKLTGHENDISALGWLPDGSRVISGSHDNTLIQWDAKNGNRIGQWIGHRDRIVALAVSPDGKIIASGSDDRSIRLWNGKTGSFIKIMVASRPSVPADLSFSPDGKKLLSGSAGTENYDCHIYSVPAGKELVTFTKHKNIVLATAVSPDGNLAATGGGEAFEITLWDINTGKVKKNLVGNYKVFWSVGFGKDNASIAWGNEISPEERKNKYGPLQFRMKIGPSGSSKDLNRFRVEYEGDIQDPGDFIRALESQGGYQLRIKEGGDAVLQVIKNGVVISEIERGSTSGFGHTSYSLTPNNQYVVSGGGNGFLTLYETETGKRVWDFVGHTGEVWSVAVSPDGTKIVSGADDNIRVWDLHTGELLVTIFFGTDKNWVAWTKSGFFTSSPHGDRFIGWQINKGEDKNPEFYSAPQFADILYQS